MYGGLSRLNTNHAAIFYVFAFLTVLFGMRNLENEDNDYVEKIQYAVASIEDLTTTIRTETVYTTAEVTTTEIATIKTTTRRKSTSTENTIESVALTFPPTNNLPQAENETSTENKTIAPLFEQKSHPDTKIFKRANSMYEKCESLYNERPKNWKSPKFCREDSGYRKSFQSKSEGLDPRVEKLT